jgi:hypothetical protein
MSSEAVIKFPDPQKAEMGLAPHETQIYDPTYVVICVFERPT